jgi:hypothetical protein
LIHLLIWAAGLGSGIICLILLARHPAVGFSEEERIGFHLANGDGFLSPFAPGPAAPPTSWCPPIYPGFIALVYHTLGPRSPAAVLAILGFNLLCRAAAAVAVLRLGEQFFSLAAGLLAAGIFLLNPIFWNAALSPWDNSLALAMFLWLLVAAIAMSKRRGTTAEFVALGLALGLLILTNTAYALAIAVPAIIAQRQSKRRAFLITLAAALLTLLPWTARNFATFHQLIFVRANAYTELWLGNQPGSTGWLTRQVLELHPSTDRANHDQILSLGEPAYFALCRRRFLAEYDAAPAQFWQKCGNRAAYLFLGEPGRQYAWVQIGLAALGLAGAWTAHRLHRNAGPLMAAGLLAVAPYLPTQVHDRYVLPLRSLLALTAGFLLCEMCRRFLRQFEIYSARRRRDGRELPNPHLPGVLA